MFIFYKSQLNPSNVTGEVGGNISSYVLSGYLNELFPRVDAPPVESTGEYIQYRKIFIKNEYESSSTNTRIWLDAEQHRGQISIASISGASYSITNGLTEPTGISSWTNGRNYAEGLNLGTLSANSSTGVWIRQVLSNITEEDPFASVRIYIGGIVQ